MREYITGLLSQLSVAQRERLQQLVEDAKIGGITSIAEASDDFSGLLAVLEASAGEAITTFREMGGRINGQAYTDTQREMAVDIAALFRKIDDINKALARHESLEAAIVQEIESEIKALDTRIKNLTALRSDSSHTVAEYETFRDFSGVENDMINYGHLYADRDGSIVGPLEIAKVDTAAGQLTLPVISDMDMLHSSSGSTTANIIKIEQAGSGLIAPANSTNPPSFAIDGSGETFWAEVILADGPLNLDPLNGGGAICKVAVSLNAPHVINHISMRPFGEYPIEVLEIVAQESESATATQTVILSADRTTHPGALGNETSTEGFNFDFAPVTAKVLYITIRQVQYTKKSYLITDAVMRQADFWAKVAQAELQRTYAKDEITPALTQDKLDQLSNWTAYLDAMARYERDMRDRKWKPEYETYRVEEKDLVAELNQQIIGLKENYERSAKQGASQEYLNSLHNTAESLRGQISNIVGSSNLASNAAIYDETYQDAASRFAGQKVYHTVTRTVITGFVPTTDLTPPTPVVRVTADKYKYVYGLYELQVKGRAYQPTGIFVSKSHEAVGNVAQVSLETVERHPVNPKNVNQPMCLIEYYVTNKENPARSDWYPILPLGENDIKAEALMFNTRWEAPLRFPARFDTIKVYANGAELSRSAYHIGGTGGYYSVNLNAQPAADIYYSAAYLPDASIIDPHVVDFRQRGATPTIFVGGDGLEGELFPSGTNRNGFVNLTYYPYVDQERVLAGDPAYRPLEVNLTGAIAGPGANTTYEFISEYTTPVALKNVTDYKANTRPNLHPYDTTINGATGQPKNLTLEYAQEENRIYFSETFNGAEIAKNLELTHGNAAIRIKYSYLVGKVRLKAIARRLLPGMESITPALDSYTIKFKVI